MTSHSFIFACCTLLASAVASPPQATQRTLAPASPQPLTPFIRCFAGLQERSFEEVLAELAKNDIVLVGELHNDAITHRSELAILQGLSARRHVTLSLEMFERDEQEVLDRYLAGKINEAQFAKQVSLWGNYKEAYRPLIEFCKAKGLAVVGANGPRSLLRKVSRGKQKAFEALSKDERRLLPRKLFANSASYWERYDRIVRAHGGRMGPAVSDRLYWVQNLWDNTMGESIVDAHRRDEQGLVLHFAGEFHIAFRDGTTRQVLNRAPHSKVQTVTLRPSQDLVRVDPRAAQDRADYMIYVDKRGSDPFNSSKFYSVPIQTALSWRLLGAEAKGTSAAPRPLILWLPDHGQHARDLLPWLKRALAQEATLVILEPPFVTEREGQVSWFENSSLPSASSAVLTGIERILEYLRPRFDFDSHRIVLAGEGRAATLVLALARSQRSLHWTSVAVSPRDVHEAAAAGWAAPPLLDKQRRLQILDAEPARFDGSLKLDAEVGIASTVKRLPDSGLGLYAIEALLRKSAALPAMNAPAATQLGKKPQAIYVEHPSPSARAWARSWIRAQPRGAISALLSSKTPLQELPKQGLRVLGFEDLYLGTRQLKAALKIADLQKARLPRHSSPFGGKTVLVVPAGSSKTEAWRELVAAQNKRGRKTYYLAFEAAQPDSAGSAAAGSESTGSEPAKPSLEQVLAQLRAKNMQRILIVPAEFCASPERLRQLAKRAKKDPRNKNLELEWRQGLGDKLRLAR